MLTTAGPPLGLNAQVSPKASPSPLAGAFELHPLSVVRMLWKHKLLILAVWFVVALAGALLVRLQPSIYRAESLILVDSQKIPERFVASTVQVALQDHLATISQQILSSTQLEKVVQKFGLYAEERQKLSPEQIVGRARKDIEITLEKGWGGGRPGAFRIAYEGMNPNVVASVVNELSGLFIAENLKARELRAEDTSEFIESQLREARRNLEQQEADYSRFKLQRMGELPQQEAALSGTLNRLQAELSGNQDAINRAEQNKAIAENSLRVAEAAEAMVTRSIQQATAPLPAGAPVPRIDRGQDPVAPPAPPKRSETLAQQLEALRIRYQEEHPEIRRLKRELETALRQEANEPAPARPTRAAAATQSTEVSAPRTNPVPSQLLVELSRERERISAAKSQLSLISRELESRAADRQRILRSIGEYQGKLERIPMREQEMASITRDYENSKANYRSLLDKKISAELAAEMERRQQAERFTLQDPARVPTQPIKPNRRMLNLAAIIAGFIAGIILALGLEFKKNQFLGEWELPAGVTVLGRIPPIRIAAPANRASALQGAGRHV